MAHIIFYTKPGCIGGTKQKAFLREAGHTVEERSILTATWTPAALRPFFGTLPVAEWYNPNAPAVKAGTVVPGALPEQAALEELCRDPILIKRPLMQIGTLQLAGFSPEQLRKIVQLSAPPAEDLTTCQMVEKNPCPPSEK